MKKKTKNHVKHKKIYITDTDGYKYAPFRCDVSYDAEYYFATDLDSKLMELAERNSGIETGSGMGMGERDISFDFFTEKGLKQFAKKAEKRYGKYDIVVTVTKASVEVDYEEFDL